MIGPGAKAGFKIFLKFPKPDLADICRGPVQGFKIYLHTPGETRASKQFFRVQSKQDVQVSIKPNVMATDEGLVKYSPERRQCFFNNERSLQFYKIYTQNNCELECLVNLTLERCNCVKFSMPRANSTKICGQKEIPCCSQVENSLMLREVDTSWVGHEEDRRGTTHCGCLPACTSISFDAEFSQSSGDVISYFRSLNAVDPKLLDNKELASLTISFKEAQFIASKRSELYDWKDFMANCGGFLGKTSSFYQKVEIF